MQINIQLWFFIENRCKMISIDLLTLNQEIFLFHWYYAYQKTRLQMRIIRSLFLTSAIWHYGQKMLIMLSAWHHNVRTCCINDQCRSIPINDGSNFWHWSKMYLNKGQCRSMKINIDQYFSKRINADQFQSMPINQHWSALIGIEKFWELLIFIERHW